MSADDDRPWLGRYGDQPADYEIEFGDALSMFRAGVARDPDGVALRYFDGAVTRRELDETTDALAAGLLAEGFSPGDRLAVYLQNVPQFVMAMVATWKAGGVMVSINPMSRTRELSYLLADSGASVLLCLDTLYDEVARDVVPDTGVALVLHNALMRNLGVTLTEIADLEALAADSADDGQYEGLYVAAPLKVHKGSGSPVNPVVLK